MAHLIGTSGNDSLVGTAGDDTLEGLGGNDTLIGNGGNDRLIGGAGSDSMNGGLGDDTYVVDSSGDVLSDSGGTDTVETSVSWTLAAGFENLTFTGTGTTSGHGNSLNNVITGSAGNNWLRGLEGNDTIFGGAGNDTINMSNGSGASYGNDVIGGGEGVDTLDYGAAARTAVFVDLAAGTASGGGTGGAGSATLTSIENVNGSAFNDRITGNAAANFLYGYDGSDTLDGGAGNDRLEGAAGNDQYVFTASPGSANADTVVGFVSGADKIVLDGSVHANLGANGNFSSTDGRFAAGAGFNSGQDAGDRVIYNTSTGQLWYDADGNGSGAAQLIATLQGAPTLTSDDIAVQNSSSGRVEGTEGSDFLEGTSGNDTIDGRGGPDFIHGLEGDDSLIGGADDDFLSGGHGADTLEGGAGNDNLRGDGQGFEVNIGDDLLRGGDGNDTLSGGPGNNTLDGGLGDDEYHVSSSTDVLIDAGGVDHIVTFHLSWTLGAGFENLSTRTDDQGGSAASFLIGNELDNVIDGSETNQIRIEGLGGNDTLFGSGIDGHGELHGGDGDDEIYGGHSATMFGGAGNDLLEGGFRPDILDGGTGNDTLQGGEDSDRYVFSVTPASANADLVIGFSAAEADVIVLDSAAMPALGTSGTFASNDVRFASGAGFNSGQDPSDRVIYDTTTGRLWYDADGSGTGAAQLIATLQGAPALAASNIEVAGQAIDGTSGDDSLMGTPGNDTINGFGGNDNIDGNQGADLLVGGDGNDTLWAGLDSNTGDHAADTLDGGMGDDVYRRVSSLDGDAILADPGGIDTVFAIGDWTLGSGLENLRFDDFFGGHWRGVGNELNNTIVSASAGGSLFGMGGDDLLVIANAEGFGVAHGGDGNDTLEAGRSSELFGDAGNDVLIAFDVGTTMSGGAGNDSFVFESAGGVHQVDDFASGADKIRLDATNMSALGASGNFAAGDARFHAAAGATGGHDADDRVIYNTSTGDLFYDADGSGSGASELIVTLQPGASVVATDIAVDNGTAGGGSTINGTAGNDTLTGGAGNDTINGLAGADMLQGLGGNDSVLGSTGWDTLQGGDGNDWLQGGGWSDTLTGGAGNDSFVWAEAGTNNRDTVTDFASGTDELLFENGTLTAMGAAGSWAAGDGRFWAAAGAVAGHDADDRLVYNTSTGNLYYDADGGGAGAAQIVATFQGNPAIAASDITVI